MPKTYKVTTQQIAAESGTIPGDMKNVLDRCTYYMTENLIHCRRPTENERTFRVGGGAKNRENRRHPARSHDRRNRKRLKGVTGVTDGVTGWTRFLQGLPMLVFFSLFEEFSTPKTTRCVTGVTGSLQTFTRTREREPKCLALKVSTFISFLRKVCKSLVASVTSVTPYSRNGQAIKQLQKIFRKDEKSRILPPAFPRVVLLSRGTARDRSVTDHRPDQAMPATLCRTHPQRQPAVRQASDNTLITIVYRKLDNQHFQSVNQDFVCFFCYLSPKFLKTW